MNEDPKAEYISPSLTFPVIISRIKVVYNYEYSSKLQVKFKVYAL